MPTLLIQNLKALVSPSINHAIFANAGTLAAVLVLGWRRRFLPYMTVILAFLAGQFMYGTFNEFRIFMQILPLSLILLSEWWMAYTGAGVAGEASSEPAPAWALRETFPVLVPMTIVLIGLSTGVAARQYSLLFRELRQAHSELGKYGVKPEGLADNLELLRNAYADAELELAKVSVTTQQLSNAVGHYQRVLELDPNSVPALSVLAWLRATASDPGLRNGPEAVRLAERACQLTQYQEAVPIRSLAAAYAEAGRFDDAVAAAQKVLTMVLAQGPKELAAQDEHLLELYKSGRAYHEEAQPVP